MVYQIPQQNPNGVISTDKAPAPGNYSQARVVELRDCLVVYISGQTGNDPKTDKVVMGGIGPQTTQALSNIQGILESVRGVSVRGGLEHVVDMTVFLENMERDKKGFEEAYTAVMPKPLPARALVEVTRVPLLSEETVVELKAIAYIPRYREKIAP